VRRWAVGGFGSGQRSSKKGTVENRYAIDTSDLKRANLLVPGTTNRAGAFIWRRGADDTSPSSVGYLLTLGTNGGTLRLRYSMTSLNANLDYSIRLVTTPCRLGGVRWWFRCPLSTDGVACGRRARKLYWCGKWFGCRGCHGLAYTSSQRSDRRVYAALRCGAHLNGFGNLEGMSVAQMGFALKVLNAGQKRLERIGKRLDRIGRTKRPKP
jgi:hypothetical protein